jgi:periplasmic divalent cation tolerance protein
MRPERHDHIMVFITAADREEAGRLAQRLLEERLAACVNIIAGADSRFWWRGRLDEARESLLIVKTRGRLLADVIDAVKKVHSYDVPEIIALPIIGGNPEYLDWIDEAVRPGRGTSAGGEK